MFYPKEFLEFDVQEEFPSYEEWCKKVSSDQQCKERYDYLKEKSKCLWEDFRGPRFIDWIKINHPEFYYPIEFLEEEVQFDFPSYPFWRKRQNEYNECSEKEYLNAKQNAWLNWVRKRDERCKNWMKQNYGLENVDDFLDFLINSKNGRKS